MIIGFIFFWVEILFKSSGISPGHEAIKPGDPDPDWLQLSPRAHYWKSNRPHSRPARRTVEVRT